MLILSKSGANGAADTLEIDMIRFGCLETVLTMLKRGQCSFVVISCRILF